MRHIKALEETTKQNTVTQCMTMTTSMCILYTNSNNKRSFVLCVTQPFVNDHQSVDTAKHSRTFTLGCGTAPRARQHEHPYKLHEDRNFRALYFIRE